MPKRFGWFAFILFLGGVAGLCYSSSPQASAPAPPDLNIESPDPALPAEVKALTGKWAGQWNSKWDSVLYVEKVGQDSAQVVFAWGEYNTRRGTCHCEPNWVRVKNARIKYSAGKAVMEFYTPILRPRWLKESHTVTGSYDETYNAGGGSSGRYAYSFVLHTHEPNVLRGDFLSARSSPLRIKMLKTE